MACETKELWRRRVRIGDKEFEVRAKSLWCVSDEGGYIETDSEEYLEIIPLNAPGNPVEIHLWPEVEEVGNNLRVRWTPRYKLSGTAGEARKYYTQLARKLGLTKKELTALMGLVSGFGGRR